MIVAERKAISDIVEMIRDVEKLLVVGCGTCVTVCMAGGEKEVALVESALRLARRRQGRELITAGVTVQRQCEWEFIDEIQQQVLEADAILSLGCGAGIQALAERFCTSRVFPGVNTSFIGIVQSEGVWTEKCAACGDCMLHKTAGVCPIARCAKQILNGPCGGSQDGKCEIDQETECAWQIIYDRLIALGRAELLEDIEPPKDWTTAGYGGPRGLRREDMIL